MLIVVPPLFVKVSDLALLLPIWTLPNERLVGDADNAPGVVPVPDSAMFSGEPGASETMARLPLTAPAVAGVNFTANVTLWLAARVAGNVSPLIEKPAPLTLACEIVILAPPVLVSVSDLLLEFPICTLPKARLDGFAVRAPSACPVPSNVKTHVLVGGAAWVLRRKLVCFGPE